MPTALVIDDDRSVHLLVKKTLEGTVDVVAAETAEAGLKLLGKHEIDVVLLDIMLPDASGLAVFCNIREADANLPVIVMTVEAGSETAIEAMQLGAFDFVAKPLNVKPLKGLVTRAIEIRDLTEVPVAIAASDEAQSASSGHFVGRSQPMLEVFKTIGRVANQAVPVLIQGESGTGKELVAEALVQHSDRRDRPFLEVNCAALPENLLESELFGHEKGAFTGADSRRIGKFEQANGGTIFLDEIGDMSASVQAKVLRVLQEQRFERVGGNHELKTDVRMIAATNRSLDKMVADGEYREDLMYRLNGVTISLPPLRQRAEDIPLLAGYFLNQAKHDLGKPKLKGISPDATELLQRYRWPGNVRQLRAVIRRAVLDCVMPVIVPDSLPPEIRGLATQTPAASLETSAAETSAASAADAVAPSDAAGTPANLAPLVDQLLDQKSTNIYAEALERMERYVLSRVLEATGGNQSQAAELLGITRGKIRARISAYQLNSDT